MGEFEDFLGSGSNFNGDKMEYYEDTHDRNGVYRPFLDSKKPLFGTKKGFFNKNQNHSEFLPINDYNNNIQQYSATQPYMQSTGSAMMSSNYENVVIYEPKTPQQTQTLIDYLKRQESAIVKLDKINTEIAKRILDFLSGAAYSLGGSVHPLGGNMFLLSPKGVTISTPL